jgi:DNA-binding NtrC family response regulator
VGDQRTRRIDVRLLAATAKDLAVEAAAGRFRDDLFDRLNVVTINLPPLSQRRDDIAPLARYFAERLGQRMARRIELSAAALEWLERQAWPGNVRQLEHAVERAAVLSDATVLEPSHFVRDPVAEPPALTAGEGSGTETLADAVAGVERAAIGRALAAAQGNRREAARRLGVSVRTLFYKLREYGLE